MSDDPDDPYEGYPSSLLGAMYDASEAEIARLTAEVARLKEALTTIAAQDLTSETDEEGDLEYGYNEIIRRAREALTAPTPPPPP